MDGKVSSKEKFSYALGSGGGNIITTIVGSFLSTEVADYGEWKFGIRSEGLINSCVSFGQKIGLGLGAATALMRKEG